MNRSAADILREKTLELILKQKEFEEALNELAQKIKEECRHAPNEATVASNFEILLYTFMKDFLGMSFLPTKEMSVDTQRHVSKGRIDSRIGALIIEYKNKDKLNNKKLEDRASCQIIDYMKTIAASAQHETVGLVTDGVKVKFIVLDPKGSIIEGAFESLASTHLSRLIKSIVLLQKTALSAENLVRDFCGPNPVAKKLYLALYDALTNHITDRTNMLFTEWQALFRLAHDDQSKQQAIIDRKKALAEAIGISIAPKDNLTEYLALYAIQTAYAIIIKIIAYKVLTSVRFKKGDISFSELASADSSKLRSQLYRLEEGAIFREMGIGNLLEGDFFAWYCIDDNQWTPEIAGRIKEAFSLLTVYEDHTLLHSTENICDLFKDLYSHVIPDKVRHSLGEFYTPPWLADNLIEEAIRLGGFKDWRALDPCSGSGTFITVLLNRVLKETKDQSPKVQLAAVLHRVKAIDLNPLAVLTARINYFINICHLLDDSDNIEIPVYLGDSSYVPEIIKVDGIDFVQYQITTLKGTIDIRLPASAIKDSVRFSTAMITLETLIKGQNEEGVFETLYELVDPSERNSSVDTALRELTSKLVELEKNDWNGIWARIITNFLTTSNLGCFELIVGNPPWIDWKNLPAGYRERIKSICIDKKLFSGDSITGGINLNICALIANVAAENWLSKQGVLAFLMPENLIFQQSYEGFRQFYLKDNSRLYFQEFFDWTKSGHPFAPVQHRFLTFFISKKEQDYSNGLPVRSYIKKMSLDGKSVPKLTAFRNTAKFQDIRNFFEVVEGIAFNASNNNSIFTFSEVRHDIDKFTKIAGLASYKGREGIEVYPQELFLLKVLDRTAPKGKVFVENYQNKKSKHKIAAQQRLLETKFMNPLVKGVNITRFHVEQEYYVPFPYEYGSRSPIPQTKLAKESTNLLKYLLEHKSVMEAQTEYNEKIIGKKHSTEFYSLARVGEYSYGEHFVTFRDNSKWVAAVVSSLPTPWGELKRPVFQNHAVSISQREDGKFITFEEAHYICAILNAPCVGEYLLKSSDSRSFKIRPPVKIPVYDPKNKVHRMLSRLSIKAHKNYADKELLKRIDEELDRLYLALL